MKTIEFHMNDTVLVKLTDHGRALLAKRNQEFNDWLSSKGRKPITRPVPKEDAEGWSRWQLHALMYELGHAYRLAAPPPFEDTILFEVEDK